MQTSTHSALVQPVVIRLLLACGAIGPLLFMVVFLIEGATRPHYSVWRNAVSALELGEGGLSRVEFLREAREQLMATRQTILYHETKEDAQAGGRSCLVRTDYRNGARQCQAICRI